MEMNLSSIIIDAGKSKWNRYHIGILLLLGGGILICALIIIIGGLYATTNGPNGP